MNKKFSKTFLVLMGLFLAVVLAEAATRVFYTKPWYEHLVEEQILRDKINSFRFNSYGLRDRDYSPIKQSNSIRVLILGDSFTFGSGVEDDSLIFPELLEKRLGAELSVRGKTIEILNGGIPGSRTDAWVDLLVRTKDSFQPDVILIVFFLRDGTRLGSMKGFFRPIRDQIVFENQKSLLYEKFYLFRLYKDALDRSFIADHYVKAYHVYYFGNEEETKEWRTARQNILKIQAIADDSRAKVGFVVFPLLVELRKAYPFQNICEEISQFSTNNKIPTHDLLPAFLGKNAPDLWVSPYDQHPNALGHEIAANSMFPFLRELILSLQPGLQH